MLLNLAIRYYNMTIVWAKACTRPTTKVTIKLFIDIILGLDISSRGKV
jgi:hypothetical protein